MWQYVKFIWRDFFWHKCTSLWPLYFCFFSTVALPPSFTDVFIFTVKSECVIKRHIGVQFFSVVRKSKSVKKQSPSVSQSSVLVCVCSCSQGVVTAATSLITTLAQKSPDDFKTSVSLAVARLSRVGTALMALMALCSILGLTSPSPTSCLTDCDLCIHRPAGLYILLCCCTVVVCQTAALAAVLPSTWYATINQWIIGIKLTFC